MKNTPRVILSSLSCFIIIILSAAFIAGCSPVNVAQLYPVYDNSSSINFNENAKVYYIVKTQGSSEVSAGLLRADDIIIAKIRIKNLSKSIPMLVDLNNFSLKDQGWDIQPRMTFDEVYEIYNKKHSSIANNYIPPPKKQYVIEGGTTVKSYYGSNYANDNIDSNYVVREQDDPYSAFSTSFAKGFQSGQLKQIQELVNNLAKNSYPEQFSIEPETALGGFVYFRERTSNCPYKLTINVGADTYIFKYSDRAEDMNGPNR